jgi:nucleoside-diphosphate kinase
MLRLLSQTRSAFVIVCVVVPLLFLNGVALAFANNGGIPPLSNKITTAKSAAVISSNAANVPTLSSTSPVLVAGGVQLSTVPGVQRTFVALKPDTYKRKLVGKIISRIEDKGFDLVGMKMIPTVSLDDVEKHYEEHKTKPFYPGLIDFFRSGPIIAMVWEGEDVISVLRKLVGATLPLDAQPGTIRGDFCYKRGENLIHCSDSKESAMREIDIWFPNSEGLSTPSP